jgi:hypothetical protein
MTQPVYRARARMPSEWATERSSLGGPPPLRPRPPRPAVSVLAPPPPVSVEVIFDDEPEQYVGEVSEVTPKDVPIDIPIEEATSPDQRIVPIPPMLDARTALALRPFE